MDLFSKVHIFEPMKIHIYEPNISLTSLISLMFNCAKPCLLCQKKSIHVFSVILSNPIHPITTENSGTHLFLGATPNNMNVDGTNPVTKSFLEVFLKYTPNKKATGLMAQLLGG